MEEYSEEEEEEDEVLDEEEPEDLDDSEFGSMSIAESKSESFWPLNCKSWASVSAIRLTRKAL